MNKKMKRIFTGLLIALALGGGGYGYLRSREASTQVAGPTVEVRRGSLKETASAAGNIAPHVQVEVKSRASGAVIEILVKEGDQVEAGQLLARLDPTDSERTLAQSKVALDKARADLVGAQASLSVAVLESKNSQADEALALKTADLGLGPRDSVRTATKSAKVASANVTLKSAQITSSQAQLKTAELAVQDAETRLKECDIKAPMAGTVLVIPIEKGTIISSALTNVSGGSSVMTIADLTDLRIIGAIDESQIAKVKPGQMVEIRVDAYAERVFEGKVERVSPLGISTSSVVTFDVEIVIQDKNVALLRSGMSADVEIVTASQEDVLLIPLVAVETKGRARFVRLPDGQQRTIKTGSSDGTNLVVLEGVDDGETILASAPVSTAAAKTANQSSGGMGMMGGGRPPGGGR